MQLQVFGLVAQVVVESDPQLLAVDQAVQHFFLLGYRLQPLLNLRFEAFHFLQGAGRGDAGLMAAQPVVVGPHGGRVVDTGQHHLGHHRPRGMNPAELRPGHQAQNGREHHHDKKADAQLGAYPPIRNLPVHCYPPQARDLNLHRGQPSERRCAPWQLLAIKKRTGQITRCVSNCISLVCPAMHKKRLQEC